RMTNLNLEPGEGTREDLIGEVDDGLYLETNKSWSIDDKRLNFQFGTQVAWEIKRGRLGRMLRDATYTGITPQFWGSLDAVAGPEAWVVSGLTNCGKGQPGQSAHVSESAASAPAEESFPGLADPAPLPAAAGYDEDTAGLGPEDQAGLAAAAIDASNLPTYGYLTSGLTRVAVASSRGVRAEQTLTDAT